MSAASISGDPGAVSSSGLAAGLDPGRPPPAGVARPMGLEVLIVTLISVALLVPGLWSYSLVDPWETHYGEVARRMLQDHDWVHTDWQNEGFRSKPVLTFWLMAASMRAFGIASDGGYSGEMVNSPVVMLAIRLPFALFGVMGLVMTWWMLARLVSRRVAYLSLIAIASCPFYALVARQGITDMTLVGCMMGSIAMFAMATESGDDPLPVLGRVLGRPFDARHIFFAVVGGFLAWQAGYYLLYFMHFRVVPGVVFPAPGLTLCLSIVFALAALHAGVWRWAARLVINGIVIVAVIATPLIAMLQGKGAMIAPSTVGLVVGGAALVTGAVLAAAWARLGARTVSAWLPDALGLRLGLTALYAALGSLSPWQRAGDDAARAVELSALTTRRQVYLLWFYALLGVSILGKGLPALGIVGIVCFFYVLLLRRWRDLLGVYEIKRGIIVCAALAVPWHVGMWLRDGRAFLKEYFITHLLNRAAVGVFGERGTFDFYMSQLGIGMWIWAALLPAAVTALITANGLSTRIGRVRMIVAIWAITSVAFFALVQTKFHHYILPAVPALAMLVAFWLDDLLAGRARTSLVLSLVGVGIVLLITRDLMHEEKQWIEMFVFRYDRPWPDAPPYSIDTTDGLLGLGLCSAFAVLVLGFQRLMRLGVVLVCVAGLATGFWAMYAYMPEAGTHWGMRQTIRTYYEEREIYGQKLVYYGARQLADDWDAVPRTGGRWTFRTFVPDALQVGQPMTIAITVRSVDDRATDRELTLVGPVTAIGDSSVTITLPPAELEKLTPSIAAGKSARRATRRPLRIVDADRLMAWQLYWRGENFWSGDEIWGPVPEMKTALKETDNVAFLKYLNDPQIARPGRRYFIATEAARVSSLRSILPTARARDTLEVLDTTSNKFTLAVFTL